MLEVLAQLYVEWYERRNWIEVQKYLQAMATIYSDAICSNP